MPDVISKPIGTELVWTKVAPMKWCKLAPPTSTLTLNAPMAGTSSSNELTRTGLREIGPGSVCSRHGLFANFMVEDSRGFERAGADRDGQRASILACEHLSR